MARGQGQHEGVVEERRRVDQGIGDRQHDEGQVDLARGDLGHQLVRSGLDHGQVDAGMALMEGDEGGGQHAGDQAGGGPDGQAAPGHAREGAGLGAGRLDVGQHALEMKGSSALPSGVRVTRPCPGLRLKRTTPSSCSSRRTWRDSDGWARWSRAAARVKLWSSATART